VNCYSFYVIKEQSLGQLTDDKYHGKGTYVWGPNIELSGSKYVGDWIDGNMTGQGVYTDADSNRYGLRYSQITCQSLLNH
jgi:hypothetical protein